ncbi:hypothetical protein BC939DRAFT_154077 [Gamsiella multidivaricata]|uniref:uncharacterized protein n=1 Tax=Gamsiella multidivaricata TaxID=101098 RepID=UPI00221E48F7|nr:uncharacterized protein BC939DRAFT_154077 [Gamsiella multidivaricata]KAI7824123.1 hypothetical protein BC939DRAFT_154077 [Gamsiella multidivaricata]
MRCLYKLGSHSIHNMFRHTRLHAHTKGMFGAMLQDSWTRLCYLESDFLSVVSYLDAVRSYVAYEELSVLSHHGRFMPLGSLQWTTGVLALVAPENSHESVLAIDPHVDVLKQMTVPTLLALCTPSVLELEHECFHVPMIVLEHICWDNDMLG